MLLPDVLKRRKSHAGRQRLHKDIIRFQARSRRQISLDGLLLRGNSGKPVVYIAQLLLKLLHLGHHGITVTHLETVQCGFRLIEPCPRPLRLAHGWCHRAGLAIRDHAHRKIVGQPHGGFRRRGPAGHDQRIFIRCQFQPDRLAHRTVQRLTRGQRTRIRAGQKVEKQAKLTLIANADHIGGLQLEIGGYTVEPGG
ncbi:hypothetical protein D3C71_781720 [compost metagenome]